MNKKCNSPVIDINIFLFDPEKSHIRIIGDIGHGDRGHQPAEKSQGDQQSRIPGICMTDYLS